MDRSNSDNRESLIRLNCEGYFNLPYLRIRSLVDDNHRKLSSSPETEYQRVKEKFYCPDVHSIYLQSLIVHEAVFPNDVFLPNVASTPHDDSILRLNMHDAGRSLLSPLDS